MVIDVHIHYVDEKDYLERLLEACSAVGIDKLCLSSSGPHYLHVGNNKIKEAFLKYPDRVLGFGFVDLGKDKPELVKELAEDGFKGLKIIKPAADYDDQQFYPVYEKAQAYGLPILFHTGIVQRMPNDHEADVSSNRMRPIYLDTIARAFPELTIIGAHLGTPWLQEAAMTARTNPNVYFDITGSPYGGWRSVMTAEDYKKLFYWENAFEKIVFGTDVKIEDLPRAKEVYHQVMDSLDLPKETRSKILGRTMANILKI